MASQGLPTGLYYNYADNPNGSPNEYDSNLIAVPSLTFYTTPTSTSGVTLNATTPSGAASTFRVNAVYAHDGTQIDTSTRALQAVSVPAHTFGGYWGVFGADGLVGVFTDGSHPLAKQPDVVKDTTRSVGGIIAQAVVSGTTPGRSFPKPAGIELCGLWGAAGG